MIFIYGPIGLSGNSKGCAPKLMDVAGAFLVQPFAPTKPPRQ
jgi:hypothetical protein